jgi:hypothetical protein
MPQANVELGLERRATEPPPLGLKRIHRSDFLIVVIGERS